MAEKKDDEKKEKKSIGQKIKDSWNKTKEEQKAKYEPGGKYYNEDKDKGSSTFTPPPTQKQPDGLGLGFTNPQPVVKPPVTPTPKPDISIQGPSMTFDKNTTEKLHNEAVNQGIGSPTTPVQKPEKPAPAPAPITPTEKEDKPAPAPITPTEKPATEESSKIDMNKATTDLLNEFLSVMKDPSKLMDFAAKYSHIMGQNAAANAATAAQMAGMNKAQAAMMGQNAAAQNAIQGFGKGADMRAGLAGSAGNMATSLINAQLNRDMFNQQQAYNKQQTGLGVAGSIFSTLAPIVLGLIFGSSDSRLKTVSKIDGKPVRSKYYDQAFGNLNKFIDANKPKDYKSLIWRAK